jgi:hypothetical protein
LVIPAGWFQNLWKAVWVTAGAAEDMVDGLRLRCELVREETGVPR